MALTPDPPPLYGAAPAPATRYPGTTTGPFAGTGDTITTSVSGPSFDILGRDGNRASPAIESIITTLLFNFPYQDPNGSWAGLYGGEYVGRGGGRAGRGSIILFEMRTAAEVEAAAGGAHGPSPFAVTLYNESLLGGSSVPPADGRAWSDDGIYDPSSWSDFHVHRVLVREDLLTGGAGAEWSGAAFFAESIVHEIGHVVQGMLMDLYGSDYVINNTCALFGKPSSAWNPAGSAWADRVQEASAEVYKDVMLPWRRYDNRTNFKLPSARFDDWLKLYVDYYENPYWDFCNTQAAFYTFNFSLDSVQSGFQPSLLFVPDYAPETVRNPSIFNNIMHLPLQGDTPHLHFNFGWSGGVWIDDGSDPTFVATYGAKVKLGAEFWKTNYTDFLTYHEDEINPVLFESGAGSFDIAIPPGLPSDGYAMALRFPGSGPWEFPRADAPPHNDPPVLPFEDFQGGGFPRDGTQPWWSWNGLRRARYALRPITWPYSTPVVSQSGPPQFAVAQHARLRLGPGGAGIRMHYARVRGIRTGDTPQSS